MSVDTTIGGDLEVTRTAGTYTINTDPVSRLTTNGQWYGEALAIGGTGSPTAGNVYYYNSVSSWSLTDADAAGSSKGLLAIATNGAGFDRGMLIRGFYKNTSWSFTVGATLYLSTTGGAITQTAPSGTGDIVRVVGYALAADEIFFDPSQDWIELV